jgi:hypothetical protein
MNAKIEIQNTNSGLLSHPEKAGVKHGSVYEVITDPGGTAGAPSVLIAYGELADQRLRQNQTIAGQYIQNLPSKLIRLRLKNSNNEKSV